jgi:hypothetical protein
MIVKIISPLMLLLAPKTFQLVEEILLAQWF